jgi:hypothetical protein
MVDQVSESESDTRDHACFVPRCKHFTALDAIDYQSIENRLGALGGRLTAILAEIELCADALQRLFDPAP